MSPRTVIASLLFALLCCRETFAQFLREQATDAGTDLQTRVTTYSHPAGVSLTLIATVHVGEPGYYRAIRDLLSDADVVLHEGARVRGGRVAFDFASALGLEKQAAQLRLVGDRFLRADTDDLAVLDTPPPPATRRALADGLLALERDPAVLRATDAAYAVRERNNIVLQALRHRLARGDGVIVLLYGAAHAPDLDRRLREDFGFTVNTTRWLGAFAIGK